MLPQVFRWKEPTVRRFIFAQIVVLSGALTLSLFQTSLAQKAQNTAFAELRLKARRAEDHGNANEADRLYLQTIEAAKRASSKTDIVEMISRLVRERAYNRKFDQVDQYIQEALDIAKTVVGTSSYDPEMSVWMDDIADVVYERGEHTYTESTKEYCARRYLDTEFLVRDKYNQEFIGRASMYCTHLTALGRYGEVIPYMEKLQSYICKTNPGVNIWFSQISLGNAYLDYNKPDQAERLLKASLESKNRLGRDLGYEGIILRQIGTARLEQKYFSAAREKYQGAKVLHDQYAGKFNLHSAWDEMALGYLEEIVGNIDQAASHYRSGAAIYQKLAKDAPKDSMIDAGQVATLEGLARVLRREGKLSEAELRVSYAGQVRKNHPEWGTVKNPDPNKYFLIWGHFPAGIEAIPTRNPLS